MSRALPQDTRGIVDPGEMARHASLRRYPAGELLDGIVDWFWAVGWQLPAGGEHIQRVVDHPGGHITIGTTESDPAVDGAGARAPGSRIEGRVYGLITHVSERRLSGAGWTVAAKTTTGGLGGLLDRPARLVTDRALRLDDALGLDGPALIDEVDAAGSEPARVDRLREALESVARQRDPARLATAREVAAIARVAETDRSVLRVEQLAGAAGVGVRTLQRLFAEYVGASPAWVLRRWRIIEAAERAGGPAGNPSWPGWAQVAVELGYSDQAHLVRDVRRHLGEPPGRYRSRQESRA